MGDGAELSAPPGIGVDIIKLAAKELGINLNIVREPNKRVHANFESGVFDLSGFYSYSASREKWGVFPSVDGKPDKEKRIFLQSYYLYAFPNSDIKWDGVKITGADLIGANSGYSVVKRLKELGAPVNEAKSISQNLEMLARGRINAYAAQDAAIDPIIATYPEWSGLVKVGPPLRTKEYYVMFSHKFYAENKPIADSFWDKITEIRDLVINRYKDLKIKPEIK
jgi:polar amino acid transport system substrate-binding protein